LEYIDLSDNKINSVLPNIFDGLQKLKLVDLESNRCIDVKIGCETCLIKQFDINGKLQSCFEQLAQEPHQTDENIDQETGLNLDEVLRNLMEELDMVSRNSKLAIEGVENQLSGISKALRNSLETLAEKIETGYECGRKLAKEAAGKMKMMASFIQEKFNANMKAD
jgi:hypothetical protein